MVHAEKLVTALDRGTANTRWRDFADVHMLSRRHDVDGDHLHEAVHMVANHRNVVVVPLRRALGDLPNAGQTRWAAWRRRQVWEEELPENLNDVVEQICAFGDPLMAGLVRGHVWNAAEQRWHPNRRTGRSRAEVAFMSCVGNDLRLRSVYGGRL